MMDISADLYQWFTFFFAKKHAGASTSREIRIDFEKKQLEDELHKPYWKIK